MRILVLSFYFPPDLAAGSFRAAALTDALMARLARTDRVHVLTTMPNRYASFRPDAASSEEGERLQIERIALPPHAGRFADQARAFAHFAYHAYRSARRNPPDIVFATSSRLMTASLGALIARRAGARLVLDIRDLFPDTMRAVLSGPAARILPPVLDRLEAWTMRQAKAINVVSPGFVETLRKVRPGLEPSVLTNGIDPLFIGHDYARSDGDRPTIVYAGNLGDGQALEKLVPAAAAALGGRYRFRIIGDGGRREALNAAIERLAVDDPLAASSIELLPPVSREALIDHYARADVLLMHLNDYAAFRKVLPSKLFEYAATGKPILAGVSGTAATFLADNVPNVGVFPPCDVEAFLTSLAELDDRMTPRTAFIERFHRATQMAALAEIVLGRGGEGGRQ